MRKSMKTVAATLMAATMVLGSMSMAFAGTITEADVADEAKYVVVGGFGEAQWTPTDDSNLLQPVEGKDGIYSLTATLPSGAQFKFLRLDDVSIENPWTANLCLGTDKWDDNQTQLTLSTTEDVENATFYLDVNSGTTVVLDADGNKLDYKFRWVGFGEEGALTSLEEFDAIDITSADNYPQAKIKVSEKPASLVDATNALYEKVKPEPAPEPNPITESDVENDVLYTVAGNFGDFQWSPADKSNLLTAVEKLDGVYSIKATLPADAQFKIIKLDDISIENPWTASLCLGTDKFDDNQTQIYVGNENEIKDATIYFDSKAGTVAIVDSEGKNVDYNFRWVGFGEEGVLTSLADFDAIDITSATNYPQDKIKVTEKPASLVAAVQALYDAVTATPEPANNEDNNNEQPANNNEQPANNNEQPAVENPTTAAPAANNNPTTAAKQAAKTGDVAPVAILFTLVAAVAVVTVAAKKKEA